MSELVTIKAPRTAVSVSGSVVIPAAIADAGEHAVRRFPSNSSPRRSATATRARPITGAVCSFFAWLEQHDIGELADIEPMHVSLYIETLQATAAKPTVKQHLAAIRMLFDWLVVGQVVEINPAAAVRGPKHVVKKGKTPVLEADEARQLLDSIDVSTPVGLRDRALIALLIYTFARVSAAIGMNVADYYVQGRRSWVRLHEKGGKRHEMPAHHLLETYVDEYLADTGLAADKAASLFPTAAGRTGKLTDRRMTRTDALRMIWRRAAGRHRDRARLPLLPRDRHHRLSQKRRAPRTRPADGRARKRADHQALRPQERQDHAR